MIKINLLDSVTDRSKGVAVVEEKVANPRMQTMLMGAAILSLLVLMMGYDYLSSRAAHLAAQKELANQQRIQAQMIAINKEQADLEQKTKDIEVRINAIQKLRASQQGPSTVLKEIKDRVDSVPGLYLESVEQNGSNLVVRGNSPNEASVTRFGQSLEFSSGLFTNLNIETERKELKVQVEASSEAGPNAPQPEKPEIVNFTIKCSYTPPPSPSSQTTQPSTSTAPAANQVAQK
jgi:Tfp pilus assembly protein PilN